MFVITIVLFFPQRRKILRLYNVSARQSQTQKIRETFCSSGGSGKTLMQTRKPTDVTVSVSTFLCIKFKKFTRFPLAKKSENALCQYVIISVFLVFFGVW